MWSKILRAIMCVFWFLLHLMITLGESWISGKCSWFQNVRIWQHSHVCIKSDNSAYRSMMGQWSKELGAVTWNDLTQPNAPKFLVKLWGVSLDLLQYVSFTKMQTRETWNRIETLLCGQKVVESIPYWRCKDSLYLIKHNYIACCHTCPLLSAACWTDTVKITMVINLITSSTVLKDAGNPVNRTLTVSHYIFHYNLGFMWQI